MPYFSFDLVTDEEFKNQSVMILEDSEIAIDKADSLANELRVARPQLCSRGYAVRVTDRDGTDTLPDSPRPHSAPWLRSPLADTECEPP